MVVAQAVSVEVDSSSSSACTCSSTGSSSGSDSRSSKQYYSMSAVRRYVLPLDTVYTAAAQPEVRRALPLRPCATAFLCDCCLGPLLLCATLAVPGIGRAKNYLGMLTAATKIGSHPLDYCSRIPKRFHEARLQRRPSYE